MNLRSDNSKRTQQIAAQIAENLHGDEVIELIGDVGSGKTTFVAGLVKSLGIDAHVSSPTFTIENVYSGRHIIYHLDFYRLDEAGILAYDLADKIGKGIIVIEWSGIVKNLLPKDKVVINFTVLSDGNRSINIELRDSVKYVVENIK